MATQTTPITTPEDIIARLGCGQCARCRATARQGRGLVHCPIHTDPGPSLWVGPGKYAPTYVRCYAGCTPADVLQWLHDNGLSLRAQS